MITEENVKDWIHESLSLIKESDPTLESVELTDVTTILGPDSPVDSIGFSMLAADLEDKIAGETGQECPLDADRLYRLHATNAPISVRDMASLVARLVAGGGNAP